MQRRLATAAAILLAITSCHDSSAPNQGPPGMRLVSGFGMTDTVTAKPTAPPTVEMRDNVGELVPAGTVVRFSLAYRRLRR